MRGVLIERTLLCTELQEIASRSGFSQTGSGNGSEHGACSRAILTHFILGYGVTWSHHRNGTSNSGGKSRLLHSAALLFCGRLLRLLALAVALRGHMQCLAKLKERSRATCEAKQEPRTILQHQRRLPWQRLPFS